MTATKSTSETWKVDPKSRWRPESLGGRSLFYKYDVDGNSQPMECLGVEVEGVEGLWAENEGYTIARLLHVEQILAHQLYSVLECPCSDCQETAKALEANNAHRNEHDNDVPRSRSRQIPLPKPSPKY
jgi:hypothetical protein